MADVYLATDNELEREVALKILHPQYAGDAGFVERFRREAQAAAKLQHPNIVQIYDWGREGDFNYIVMEYIEGRSLKDYLADEGPLGIEEACRIAGDVLSALAYAHRSGLVHRDIKPGNILIDAGGRPHVSDFGRNDSFNTCLVEVETDAGLTGLGEAKVGVGNLGNYAGVVELIRRELLREAATRGREGTGEPYRCCAPRCTSARRNCASVSPSGHGNAGSRSRSNSIRVSMRSAMSSVASSAGVKSANCSRISREDFT